MKYSNDMYTIDLREYVAQRDTARLRRVTVAMLDRRVLANSLISLLIVVAIVAATGITA